MVSDLYSVFCQIILNVKHGLLFTPAHSIILQQYLDKLGIPLMTSTGITKP